MDRTTLLFSCLDVKSLTGDDQDMWDLDMKMVKGDIEYMDQFVEAVVQKEVSWVYKRSCEDHINKVLVESKSFPAVVRDIWDFDIKTVFMTGGGMDESFTRYFLLDQITKFTDCSDALQHALSNSQATIGSIQRRWWDEFERRIRVFVPAPPPPPEDEVCT